MRTLAATVALVLAAAAPAALSAPSGTTEADCGLTQLVVLFWPNGHARISSLGLPGSLAPQADVYRYAGSKTYRAANLVAYVDAKGKATTARRCTRVSPTRSFTRPAARSTVTKLAVTCRFNSPARIRLRTSRGRAELRLVDPPGRIALRATLASKRSTLSYSRAQCRTGKAPG